MNVTFNHEYLSFIAIQLIDGLKINGTNFKGIRLKNFKNLGILEICDNGNILGFKCTILNPIFFKTFVNDLLLKIDGCHIDIS